MNQMQLNQPPQLKLKGTTDANRNWKIFKQSWQVYEIASGTNEKSEEVRLATFLHVAGPDALEKYTSFLFNNPEDRVNLNEVIKKFDNDCKNSSNILAERNKFYQRKQKKNEPYDQYVTDLRVLCSTCEFTNPEEVLRDQFALNINNDRAKERLMNEAHRDHRSLTFDRAVMIVKAYESLKIGKVEDESEEMEVDAIRETPYSASKKNQRIIDNCKRCGRTHPVRQCPAFNRICNKCKKSGHFAIVCKSQTNVKMIDMDQSPEQDELNNETNYQI